ncbi:TIGR02530 family flagellar biosynthesis protein [Salsuginibacillus kocurii]|uniref:TIGR02530 family flagellar biosynthesis protein n=1 Tax=Salsuginibacillus kocurii TaxID=427078 RepID=UPI0003809F2F|nr:TIGR02530 family flagellar biosynthesis protein [Salsuginibacillus kocurii]
MDPTIHPYSLQPLPKPTPTRKPETESKESQTRFQDMLQQKIDDTKELKMSRHAAERMESRDIQINDEEWTKIQAKVAEAKEKGVRDSLVLTEDAALVISAKNDTVVTAMDRGEAESHIFTNIDGTIVMNKK